ncbi:Sigma non-opioid intracellular receptor 1 like [Actinidia chinensis var. chinensis]|uniref:Sigma non-opioid intracellular receptor 1 like n=1 Tax=Actinidia chinensis var. chinensis TaxID=1590841 RepID=A0A2R6RV18_ACTCC|nr:Sigma non-opioid intracellular receptor 1 like [Actinidia chinensis var. chinensis]
MKTVVTPPPTPSSVKSSTTISSMATAETEGDRSGPLDSNYFPKCRKDANCHCEMCLASINATLDLKPRSSLSLAKPFASKPLPISPISYNPSIISTPESRTRRNTLSPPLNSKARTSFHDKIRKKKRDLGIGFVLVRLVLGLGLFFAVEFGFSWAVLGVLKPDLSPEIVKNLSEKAEILQDVNDKLGFLQRETQNLVIGKVSNCSSNESLWKINQDDLLLNSRCTLYKSATEEVSIWGWPLQTSGLLTAEFSSRSLIILSGRVTEWTDGKVSYSTRKANKSWVHQKWSSSVVQLDQNTWILEYKQARSVENSRMVSAALEFLKFRLLREVRRMKQQFWLGNRYDGFTEDSFKVPT